MLKMYTIAGLFCLACIVLSLEIVIPASYALSITPRPPTFADVNGNKITTTEAGRQIMVSQTFRNEVERDMPFVSLIEIRDESGVTVLLAWQIGTMPASNYETGVYNNNTMSISWLPEKASTYEARTFAISDFENTQVLSHVEAAQFVVT